MRIRPFRRNWIFLLICIALFMTGCQTLPPSYDRGVYHVVNKGQTLYAIAKAYGMGVEALARINRIRDVNHLHVGQRLWIPRAIRAVKVPGFFHPHILQLSLFRTIFHLLKQLPFLIKIRIKFLNKARGP